jgi:predicted transcriptional regulator
MARKKKDWQQPKEAGDGWVYVLKIYTDTNIVHKIGTTNRLPKTRMLEIIGELFDVLGYAPRVHLLRQRQTKDNYKVEALVLKQTVHAQCTLGMCEWVGESELRKIDEQELLNVYDKAIAEDYAPTIKFEVSL